MHGVGMMLNTTTRAIQELAIPEIRVLIFVGSQLAAVITADGSRGPCSVLCTVLTVIVWGVANQLVG